MAELTTPIALDVLINETHNAADLLKHYLEHGIPQVSDLGQPVGVYHLEGEEREAMERECNKAKSIIHYLTEYEKLKTVKK